MKEGGGSNEGGPSSENVMSFMSSSRKVHRTVPWNLVDEPRRHPSKRRTGDTLARPPNGVRSCSTDGEGGGEGRRIAMIASIQKNENPSPFEPSPAGTSSFCLYISSESVLTDTNGTISNDRNG
jgi:hypothetical protein